MKKIVTIASIYLLMALFTTPAYSQKSDSTITPDDYYIDFSTPDIGAFTLLNIKPDNITTPGSTKEFAASLLNVVSGGSSISPGLAIDWSPAKTFCKSTTPQNYRRSYLARNIQATFGTVADSLGTKVGFGFKWTFYDDTDPLMDNKYGDYLININQKTFIDIAIAKNLFKSKVLITLREIILYRKLDEQEVRKLESYHDIIRCFDDDDSIICNRELAVNSKIIAERLDSLFANLTGSNKMKLTNDEKGTIHNLCFDLKKICNASDQYSKDVTEEFNNAKKQWLNNHWNATVITMGAGLVYNSIDAKWGTLNRQLFKTYINGKFKIKKRYQAIGMVSFGMPHNEKTTDSTIISQLFLGGRFLVGNASNRFSIDIGWSMDFAKSNSFSKQILITNIGLEFKLDDGIFLEIAGGLKGEPSNFIKNSSILALGSLKYTLKPKTRFSLPG